jgi:hypothetical protein
MMLSRYREASYERVDLYNGGFDARRGTPVVIEKL